MDWQPIETIPRDVAVYVWMPNWNGRGPLVRTRWNGYWNNEFLNGSTSPGFDPKWWAPIPEPPLDTPSPSG